MMDNLKSLTIQCSTTIIQALRAMDELRHKSLLVFDKDNFYSIITIGELQRSIIQNIPFDTPIKDVINVTNKTYANTKDSKDSIKQKMLAIMAELMPVLDENGKLVDVYLWTDFYASNKFSNERAPIDLPVVIMAGGKGTRLKPITNVIPKPMVPVGDKTILEVILNQFEEIGCHKFYMSVNYKADIMQFYLSQLDHKYDVEFFMEDKPLGTIGSVSLLNGKIFTPFFVSNCDSINDQDYRDVYEYHQNNYNDLTIVTMVKNFKIPYGVIETGEDGLIKNLKEKPEQTFQVNTGVYVLNPDLINEIPVGEFFHITQLIEKVKVRGGRVGCFPVSEGSWHDMGEWPEYLKMIKVL